MDEDRFKRLEGENPLPDKVKDAVSNLQRFERLEVGGSKAERRPAEGKESHFLCRHCGEANEKQRQTCWACHKELGKANRPAPAQKPAQAQQPQDITLVLDGLTYRSTDANLPEDVRELMLRINRAGYSEQLLAEWRTWRAARKAGPAPSNPQDPAPALESAPDNIKVFKGQRVSVIKIDSKVYTSDDKDLTPELTELFRYIDEQGVTPALMDHLRAMGKDVKFRPAVSANPSDGDMAFWNQVGQTPVGAKAAVEEAQKDLEKLREQQGEHGRIFRNALPFAVGIGYVLLRFFLG